MCCLCGGGLTEIDDGDTLCCEGTTQSETYSFEMNEYCCDGFNYCDNGFDFDCFDGSICPNYDEYCSKGQESDANDDCCDGRISTGNIERNEYGKCDNFSYCAPIFNEYNGVNEIYEQDFIGSEEEWA